jgi:peptide/nickel transport system substrate-binding protein
MKPSWTSRHSTLRGALGALALAGAALGAPAQTLTYAMNQDIRSTNPGVNRDGNTDSVTLHMVEGLVGYDAKGVAAPMLARSVQASADGRTYTFKLRKGVKFHNGAEMTSADVLWSWNRYMDPKTQWRCTSEFDGRGAVKVEKVEAPDPETFVMVIDKPSALFLATLARFDCGSTAILHKDSVGPDGAWIKPVGTGPFKLDEWRRGEVVLMSRNASYQPLPGPPNGTVGGKRPLVPTLRFLHVPDAATVKAGLLSGAIDIADVDASQVKELKASDKLSIASAQTAQMHTIILQTKDPLLANKALRQAIAAALDTTQIVQAVSDGFGVPNNSVVPSASAYYSAAQKQGLKHDPEKARRLLREAGYKGEPIKMLTNKRPIVPSFEVSVIAQAMLQAVGLNVEIENIEWATQLERYQKGNYQLQSFTYSARLDPALSYEAVTGPKAKQPRKVWDNPQAQALLDKSMEVTVLSERQKLFDDLHRMQIDDVPIIVLYNNVDFGAVAKRVKGYAPWFASTPRLWEVSVQ